MEPARQEGEHESAGRGGREREHDAKALTWKTAGEGRVRKQITNELRDDYKGLSSSATAWSSGSEPEAEEFFSPVVEILPVVIVVEVVAAGGETKSRDRTLSGGY